MFRLSRLTDYGVVVLSRLAMLEGQTMTAPELSSATALPLPTVSKVLKLLAKADVISSQRGTQGGYSLDRPADRVTVAEIVEALEGPVALTACVEASDDACNVERLCPMRGGWEKLNEAVRSALESVTLADITAGPFFPGISMNEVSNEVSGTGAASAVGPSGAGER